MEEFSPQLNLVIVYVKGNAWRRQELRGPMHQHKRVQKEECSDSITGQPTFVHRRRVCREQYGVGMHVVLRYIRNAFVYNNFLR